MVFHSGKTATRAAHPAGLFVGMSLHVFIKHHFFPRRTILSFIRQDTRYIHRHTHTHMHTHICTQTHSPSPDITESHRIAITYHNMVYLQFIGKRGQQHVYSKKRKGTAWGSHANLYRRTGGELVTIGIRNTLVLIGVLIGVLVGVVNLFKVDCFNDLCSSQWWLACGGGSSWRITFCW